MAPRAPAAPALLDALPELQAPTRASLKPSRVFDSRSARRAAIPSQAVTAAPTGGSPQPCRLAAIRKEGTLSFVRQRTDGEASTQVEPGFDSYGVGRGQTCSCHPRREVLAASGLR